MAIVVENLYKKYNNIIALEDLSFNIQKGDIFGVLGPNGAGKTTLLRILSTELQKYSGTVTIFGLDIDKNVEQIREKIAVTPQDGRPYPFLSVWELIYYHTLLRTDNTSIVKRRCKEVIDMLSLQNIQDKKCSELSGGEKQRALVATTLASNADLLFLDEPTSGLDPISRKKVYKVIKNIAKNGQTVLLSTHYMEEAENLCDKIIIINKGKKFLEGNVNDIKKMLNYEYKIEITDNIYINGINNHLYRKDNENKYIIYVNDINEVYEILKETIPRKIKVTILNTTLEDVFINLLDEGG